MGSLSAGQTNTETGFTGGSTPNQTGGFTYFRNRWYDPRTGRFLTNPQIAPITPRSLSGSGRSGGTADSGPRS